MVNPSFMSRLVLLSRCRHVGRRSLPAQSLIRHISSSMRCALPQASTAATVEDILPIPSADGAAKEFTPKIVNLVDLISQLSLIEVADLNELLKKRLNLPDAPMMPTGAMMMAPQAKEEDDAAPAVQQKTTFSVKLLKFDDTKKIPLVKEIKNLVPGLNLVQAKKFVESAPQMVQENVSKDEATQLSEKISALGGVCEII